MRHLLATTRASLVLVGVIFSRLATGTIWAQFCDDGACTKNCGMSVSISNPDCLRQEAGRNSIKFHGEDFIGGYLVHSPDNACGCQNDCTNIPGTGVPTCMDISQKATAQSYRFQLTTCQEYEAGPDGGIGNNCPGT
ncbi:hypothetical protein F4804DRAFT_337759 [Jackrogersella minutella]|nr:hypothetical protein F4804DRAFT_337759 [Jackrogersella minutella]